MARRVSDDDEAPVAEPEKRTAEAWAEAKGFLPHFREVAPPFGGPTIRSENPLTWRYNAARWGNRWVVGQELTEAQFDEAVSLEALNAHSFR